MLLISLFLFSLLQTSSTASPLSTATTVILCYPTDKIIQDACDEVEKKLSKCETATVRVVRHNGLSPDLILPTLKKDKLPAHTPIFVVGHGLADAEHRHYIATKMFWKDHPERVNQDSIPRLVEENNLISGKTINTELSKTLRDPAIWYLSCHSGGNCTEGGNVGASCSSWETTGISQVNPLIKFNLKLDPATRRILNLLCKQGQFEEFDKDSNGLINGPEWQTILNSNHEKIVTLPLPPKAKERVLKQLAPDATATEVGEAITINHTRCVNSAPGREEPFLASPVLHHFQLPSWGQQKTSTSNTTPHRTPPDPITHR